MNPYSDLTIKNPSTMSDLKARDNMLALCLRETPPSWDYASEYPLVLGDDQAGRSWCLHHQGTLVAHANLLPRTIRHLSSQKTFQIGLVGNVATHPDHRGQGHMTALIRELEKIALSQDLRALVLWSDLLQFYQTLGFTSIGRESRFRIVRDDRNPQTGIRSAKATDLSDSDLESMLRLRPKLEWNLERPLDEFRALLTIPDSHLFVRRRGARIHSWLLIGKGADMRGVIHEWGAFSADELLADTQSILWASDLDELLLLAPGNLHHHWLAPLKSRSRDVTEHPMALGRPLGHDGNTAIHALTIGFIWGLDSI